MVNWPMKEEPQEYFLGHGGPRWRATKVASTSQGQGLGKIRKQFTVRRK